jgi:hypothetical protein
VPRQGNSPEEITQGWLTGRPHSGLCRRAWVSPVADGVCMRVILSILYIAALCHRIVQVNLAHRAHMSETWVVRACTFIICSASLCSARIFLAGLLVFQRAGRM